jgi:hypothetical protein
MPGIFIVKRTAEQTRHVNREPGTVKVRKENPPLLLAHEREKYYLVESREYSENAPNS